MSVLTQGLVSLWRSPHPALRATFPIPFVLSGHFPLTRGIGPQGKAYFKSNSARQFLRRPDQHVLRHPIGIVLQVGVPQDLGGSAGRTCPGGTDVVK